MILDAYLAWKQLTAVEFGRLLTSIRCAPNVRRYLRRKQDGTPNRAYRRPEWPVMLDVVRVTNKAVMPNDWL